MKASALINSLSVSAKIQTQLNTFKNEDVNRWNNEIRNKLYSLNLQVSGQTEYEINQLR